MSDNTQNSLSIYNDPPKPNQGWVNGYPARQYDQPGASYELSLEFDHSNTGDLDVDARKNKDGAVYILTESGNAYAVYSNGRIDNAKQLRLSTVGTAREDMTVLSEATQREGAITVGQPFYYVASTKVGDRRVDVAGKTSPVVEIIVVENYPTKFMALGMNYRPELHGKADFGLPGIFEASRKVPLDTFFEDIDVQGLYGAQHARRIR